MKTMTCKQLGGGCDHSFQANTFEKMTQLSKNHGMEMFKTGDKPHLESHAAYANANENAGGNKPVFSEVREKNLKRYPTTSSGTDTIL